jgi:hypothetical protein
MTSGDVTRVHTPASPASRARHTSWAGGSGSVDHGRFDPGLVLAGPQRAAARTAI